MEHKDLLELLELPDDEFYEWLIKNSIRERKAESLADLAFRLRDEVDKIKFSAALYEVQKFCGIDDLEVTGWENDYWGYLTAKPKHWIVAALIARRLSERKE